MRNSTNDEYYTPPVDIEIARSFLGEIDLDPASNEVAQQWIGAKTYWTKTDNGYDREWFGKVWCNPPYCRDRELLYGKNSNTPATQYWLDKAITEFQSGRCAEVILLVNRSDGSWYYDRVPKFSAYFQKQGRIRFCDLDGKATASPRYSNDFLYLGRRPQEFYQHYVRAYGAAAPHSFLTLF